MATLEAIQSPHWEQTRREMSQQPLVLVIHDTSELDYTHHPALQGTGPIGDGNGRGFLQHNSLAVIPKPRQVLGLAYQQLQTRQPVPRQSTFQRRKRERESKLWLHGIRASGPAPEGCCWVDVCDRGCDFYEAMRASVDSGHHYLIRVYQNRAVFASEALDQQIHLLDYARTLASAGIDRVEIPGRGGRPARGADVCLAAAPVWVPAPAGTLQRQKQPLLAAYVIRIWEPHPPRDIEPLEWILLCSLPTRTCQELKERRDWYGCRWLAEVFHDIEKNGCGEEDRRFETAQRMEACLAVLSVVAVRIFQLRCALENIPDEPAQQVATQTEITLVRCLTGHKGRRFTVRDFVRGVAQLGGFLGRKRDRHPGVRALWRGHQRLQDMVKGVQLHTGCNSS